MTDYAANQDLHAFIDGYQEAFPDDVLTVRDPISSSEDLTSVVWELAAAGRSEMLRFSDLEGVGHEVVTNVFASRQRVGRILGVPEDSLHDEFQRRAVNLMAPVEVGDAPVLADVREGDAVDLGTVPMLTHFANDRAPYITSGIIVADGADGVGNLSYHRAMVHSSTELATSLHSRGDLWRLLQAAAERGEPLRLAMVLGGHPLFMLAASARVPMAVDERHVAGGLFGAPLEVIKTPRYGLEVPATADYVLEGVIDASDQVEEGPFGEFTGYASDRSTNNLFRVETVLRRNDPVLLDVVGGNSAEHLNLARIPRESEMAEKLKARFPGVVSLHYPNSGTHFHCYVKVKARRAGEARQIMLGLLGWDPYLKTVIAVDEDVELTDDAAVLWALATHFQPADDLFVVDGLPGSPLDPSSSLTGTTSRMALDATRGPDFEGVRIDLSDESLSRARTIIESLSPELAP
ncbi:MAG: UbiD family decarboxylase [Acidimicrobiia bacterium]